MSSITPLFTTLLQTLNYPPPKDLLDYVHELNPLLSVERSNRLGYQSKSHRITQLQPVLDYINQNVYTKELRHGEAWVNINPTGAYNVSHIHPNSDYTFVYYLTDDNSTIYLTHPHLYEQHNHLLSVQPEVRQTYSLEHYHTISPNKGDILVFPSYVPHHVESNNKYTDRISISWNSDSTRVPRVWRTV